MAIKHAKLSASGSARWLNCPGSVAAEDGYSDKGSSFAQEGTAAHELADLCLKSGESPEQYHLNTIEGVVVEHDMIEHINGYISYVKSFSGEHFYEQQVDFSEWVPGGFGTADAIVISDDVCHVIDLKYGQGVAVDAENNSQAMLYALGAYNDHGYLFDNLKEFELHIYQPRINNFDTWTISLKDLLKWGEWVKLQADVALSKDAERVPGDKQCQWCKAKAKCKPLAKFTERIINAEFDDLEDLESPNILGDSRLKNIMDNKKLVIGWFDAVEKHVTSKLLDGEKFDGYKMVAGRSFRKWSDDKDAEQLLLSLKSEDEVFVKKMVSVAQAEKLLGAKDKKLLSDLIVKPSGKPTLAQESDKRPSIDNIDGLFEKVVDS